MLTYLLTYLCGHNNPIIGFRPTLKLFCRRLCFARASSSWSHRAKSGAIQPGLSNSCASSLPPMTADHPIKHSSRRSVFIHSNDMAEPTEPLDTNTLSNVHIIEDLIQLPVGSDTVVIANSYWQHHRCLTAYMPQRHKEARV